MNWKPLTALKLTETLRRTLFVYTLHLFQLVGLIVLKLIADCLARGFSVFFRWSIWVVSENPNGNKITYVNKPKNKNEQPKLEAAILIQRSRQLGSRNFRVQTRNWVARTRKLPV